MLRSVAGSWSFCIAAVERGNEAVLECMRLSMVAEDMSKRKSSMSPPLGSPKFIMLKRRVSGLPRFICCEPRAKGGMLRLRFSLSFWATIESSDWPSDMSKPFMASASRPIIMDPLLAWP